MNIGLSRNQRSTLRRRIGRTALKPQYEDNFVQMFDRPGNHPRVQKAVQSSQKQAPADRPESAQVTQPSNSSHQTFNTKLDKICSSKTNRAFAQPEVPPAGPMLLNLSLNPASKGIKKPQKRRPNPKDILEKREMPRLAQSQSEQAIAGQQASILEKLLEYQNYNVRSKPMQGQSSPIPLLQKGSLRNALPGLLAEQQAHSKNP